MFVNLFFFFSSRRRHTRWTGDWSSDVCSSDLSCAADHGYASGAVDPKRFSRDVGTKRKGVAANAGWIARRNIEHTVRDHGRGVVVAEKELDVSRLADLHADQVEPPCHLAEVERVADGEVHLVRTEERRHARRVAAVVGVEPGAERVSRRRVWYCRLTEQRRWRQAERDDECQGAK